MHFVNIIRYISIYYLYDKYFFKNDLIVDELNLLLFLKNIEKYI